VTVKNKNKKKKKKHKNITTDTHIQVSIAVVVETFLAFIACVASVSTGFSERLKHFFAFWQRENWGEGGFHNLFSSNINNKFIS